MLLIQGFVLFFPNFSQQLGTTFSFKGHLVMWFTTKVNPALSSSQSKSYYLASQIVCILFPSCSLSISTCSWIFFFVAVIEQSKLSMYNTNISETKLSAFKASEAGSGRCCYYPFSYYDKNLNYQASPDPVRKNLMFTIFLIFNIFYY